MLTGALFGSGGYGGVYRDYPQTSFQQLPRQGVGTPAIAFPLVGSWHAAQILRPVADIATMVAVITLPKLMLPVGKPALPTQPAQPGWQTPSMDPPTMTEQLAQFRVGRQPVGPPPLPTMSAKPGWQPNQMDPPNATVQFAAFRVGLLPVGKPPLQPIPAQPGWQPTAPPDATVQFIAFRPALVPIGNDPLPSQPATPGWQPTAGPDSTVQFAAFRVSLLPVGPGPLPPRPAAPGWQTPAMDPPNAWVPLYGIRPLPIPPPIIILPIPWQNPAQLAVFNAFYPAQPAVILVVDETLMPLSDPAVAFPPVGGYWPKLMDPPDSRVQFAVAALPKLLPVGAPPLPTLAAQQGWQPTAPPDASVQLIAFRASRLPIADVLGARPAQPGWQPAAAPDSTVQFVGFRVPLVGITITPPSRGATLWTPGTMDPPDARVQFLAFRTGQLPIGAAPLPTQAIRNWQPGSMDPPNAWPELINFRIKLLQVGVPAASTAFIRASWLPGTMDGPNAWVQIYGPRGNFIAPIAVLLAAIAQDIRTVFPILLTNADTVGIVSADSRVAPLPVSG